MPKYREARIAKGLKQADISAALRPFGEYVPVPVISRYETGQSLPTPRQHEIMCKVLDSEELLSTQEVKFSFIRRVKPPVGPGTSIYRLTADLPRELADAEAPLAEKLKVCGYSTLVEWQLHNLRLLNRRYKKKKAALDGANIEDGKRIKATHSIGREEEKVNV
ncbi:helix-turn-helix transcriptional regulator [Bittarella massiliensis]|uniref:Helix-turn-helix n=1 Tax=Bittarella massiliensis (ex Durand et al. 2017) TaxID=1720313 RepID=A0AAQ1RWX3_9FIRM|nr:MULTISPECIES: helix-turn-helix transcriptional regulator [Eubacteriales]MBC2871812.1 helix-turn-helix transcriptional regulator [Bittarella massiliensis (ex Durand et al. 2017)]MCB5942621.1 helix-turn-helix transcriptional regulator [bacterium 210820-DFI.6.52]SHG51392.1 Helix-turn-helix [Bittarella massiliensis (ex Durand et al. 2017)]